MMYIVHWPDQTMFGPFWSIDQAAHWCEQHSGSLWQNVLTIHAVESPTENRLMQIIRRAKEWGEMDEDETLEFVQAIADGDDL